MKRHDRLSSKKHHSSPGLKTKPMSNRLFYWGLIVIGLSSLSPLSSALEKTVPLKLTIAAGQTKAAQLQNIYANSELEITATIDCDIQLSLIRSIDQRQVFLSNMPRDWNTHLLINDAGQYRLVFLNKSKHQCKINGQLTSSLAPADIDSNVKGNEALQKLSKQLQKLFIADDIRYLVATCNSQNAYASASTVVLCKEQIALYRDYSSSPEIRQHLTLFTLLHETAHALLTQWQYPFNSNEDVVDEFAVLLTQMMNQTAAAESAAIYFESQPSAEEFQHKLKHDDRHSLSIQRARNLRKWAQDKSLMARWMPVLIPHITSERLLAFQSASNKDLKQRIANELKNRNSSNTH